MMREFDPSRHCLSHVPVQTFFANPKEYESNYRQNQNWV